MPSTDFSYLLGRLTGGSDAALELAAEFAIASRTDPAFACWECFFRERAHLFACGGETWQASHVFIQLAMEHADDSAVTQAAQSWLAAGHFERPWLRRIPRPAHWSPGKWFRTLSPAEYAVAMRPQPDGRELGVYAEGNRIRLYDAGQPIACRPSDIGRTLVLPERRLLSWSEDGDWKIWSLTTGEILCAFPRPPLVDGELHLPGDERVAVWDPRTGTCLTDYPPYGELWPIALAGGGCVSTQQVPGEFTGCDPADPQSHAVISLPGHAPTEHYIGTTRMVEGAVRLSASHILFWSECNTWLHDAAAHRTTHIPGVRTLGAAPVGPAHFAIWCWTAAVTLWSLHSAERTVTLPPLAHPVAGAAELTGRGLLIWTRDGGMSLWDVASGHFIADAKPGEAAPEWTAHVASLAPRFEPQLGFHGRGAPSFHHQDGDNVAALMDGPNPIACWVADGPVSARHLGADGSLALVMHDEVCLLQLHCGQRRIALNELRSRGKLAAAIGDGSASIYGAAAFPAES